MDNGGGSPRESVTMGVMAARPLVACLMMLTVASCSEDRPAPAATQALSPTTSAVAEQSALGILREWDEQRAAAYAAGDAVALRRLYVAGSSAGEQDARLLMRYGSRGLTVHGMRQQVLRAHVIRRGERRLVLRVTDRLVGAQAVGAAGTLTMPADRPSTRRLTLLRREAGWRMGRVTDLVSR